MGNRKPTFLGIGATKAGTTWLWSQLNKHPDVWMTPGKELHFFDRSIKYPSPNILATASLTKRLRGANKWERQQLKRGLGKVSHSILRGRFDRAIWWAHWTFGYVDESWYVRLFDQARQGQVCGEITPSYSILEPDDISRIYAVNPEMRIIYMIRNPIERAWSGLRFGVARGADDVRLDSTDEIISRLTTPRMVLRGNYERTLDNYLAVFEASQILVCFYDAISRDPRGLTCAITSFLGIQEFPPDAVDGTTRVNASPSREMPSEVKEYLLREYSPMIMRLSQRFGSYATLWLSEIEGGGKSDPVNLGMLPPPTRHP